MLITLNKAVALLSIFVTLSGVAVYAFKGKFVTHEDLASKSVELTAYHDTDMKNHIEKETLERRLLAAEIVRQIETVHHKDR